MAWAAFFNKEKAHTVMLCPPHLTFPKPDHSHFCVFNLLLVGVLTTSFTDGPRWTLAGQRQLGKASWGWEGGSCAEGSLLVQDM